MRTARSLVVAASLALAATALAYPFGGDDGVAREGAGERRTALNGMELKPFPMNLLGELSSWTNGSPVTADSIAGKPVLIMTWSSWYKVSHRDLPVAQKMAEKYGKDGLVVIGVHDPKGWDNAAKVAQEKGVTFPFAHDANDKFRTGIQSDQAPDFYVIDRAGNMRFADIETSAVEKACEIVVTETKEQAAALPGNLAAAATKAAEDSRKSRELSENYKPGQVLDVPFTMPDATAYDAAKWPEKNNVEAANNVQGQTLPSGFEAVTWVTDKPSWNGRVIVLDFWATWCGPCKRAMPGLDALQKANRRDLVIIGMTGQSWDRPTEDVARVKSYLAGHHSAYAHANDVNLTLCNALGIKGIPHCIVMSSDGVVRWQGNPLDEKFHQAVEQVLRVDPGVQARRKAEDAATKTGNG